MDQQQKALKREECEMTASGGTDGSVIGFGKVEGRTERLWKNTKGIVLNVVALAVTR